MNRFADARAIPGAYGGSSSLKKPILLPIEYSIRCPLPDPNSCDVRMKGDDPAPPGPDAQDDEKIVIQDRWNSGVS